MFIMHNDSIYNNAILEFGARSSLSQRRLEADDLNKPPQKMSKMQRRRAAREGHENSNFQSNATLKTYEDENESRNLFAGVEDLNTQNLTDNLSTPSPDHQAGKPPVIQINEQDYYSPNFANLQNEKSMQQKIEYIHKLNEAVKFKANKHKSLIRMPGVFYRLVGEYVGEKLPAIIFTNRISFKIALSHQIEFYENQRQTMVMQSNYLQ
jgi:hypothetical protein